MPWTLMNSFVKRFLFDCSSRIVTAITWLYGYTDASRRRPEIRQIQERLSLYANSISATALRPALSKISFSLASLGLLLVSRDPFTESGPVFARAIFVPRRLIESYLTLGEEVAQPEAVATICFYSP